MHGQKNIKLRSCILRSFILNTSPQEVKGLVNHLTLQV